ncbi:type VII secretion protein EccE [Mycobacterium shigaense]|uniref:Type VII secretion protein EccE n=1 Tax=Mycobacterium shigaense TaxID=722731 RepID=A0A1Z4EHQ4_9MYCO|nr:type VII secretion protein EccE [Mycobacterium shigaense]MEA1124682.1 type VII secretion protein EccE [Mycobacterium shigaense]PRI14151.1 type VII secretion protein EccE [Mycobacterium shigaense]BAX92497.1 type VII secretion protein EccE [Mycobacterium shigaense]
MSARASLSPPTGRITLVSLAAAAAAVAFPWHSGRERWVLGVGIAVVVLLLARWHGLPVTTILRRRLALLRPERPVRQTNGSGIDARTTALLRVASSGSAPDVLPLTLIAGYAERYGLRADAVRVTSLDSVSESGLRQRETWIGLTLSAADNLAALQARSPRIPLKDTAEAAARRLADHLRESGWTAVLAESGEVPALYPESAREAWSAVLLGNSDYIAGYGVKVDAALPETLAAIWAYPAAEVWTALEVAGAGDRQTLAVAAAFRTDTPPAAGGPLPGLTSQSGDQRAALMALDPLSNHRLGGHVARPESLLLEGLDWPTTSRLHLTPAQPTVA